jgi:hypothetical protein
MLVVCLLGFPWRYKAKDAIARRAFKARFHGPRMRPFVAKLAPQTVRTQTEVAQEPKITMGSFTLPGSMLRRRDTMAFVTS